MHEGPVRGRTIADLQRRRDEHQAAADVIGKRLSAIAFSRKWYETLAVEVKIIDRVREFLAWRPDLTFSPGEIIEACHAGSHAVAKALTRLVRSGAIVRAAHAAYRIAR
jgi:hypothetical protein